jgi:tRNA A37 N6-isopentenylltransferase MiaA
MVNTKRCTSDFGIGQVRAKVWQKAFPLDRTKLMTDVDYSVSMSVKVLADYKRRYAKRELNWFTRYHHADYEFRTAYMQRLNKTFAKINKHLEVQDARKVAGLP